MELSLFSRDVIAMATGIALAHDDFDAALLLAVCDKIAPDWSAWSGGRPLPLPEAMRLLEAGVTPAKFFPAEASGGCAALAAVAGPIQELTWCATGGIKGISDRRISLSPMSPRSA